MNKKLSFVTNDVAIAIGPESTRKRAAARAEYLKQRAAEAQNTGKEQQVRIMTKETVIKSLKRAGVLDDEEKLTLGYRLSLP